MCLIVDANLASLVFGDQPSEDFLPIIDWLTSPKRKGQLIVGGQLTEELFSIDRARRFILRLAQAGRAIFRSPNEVGLEREQVIATGECRSDDPHIIVLARISGARVLCSRDKNLHQDFKNLELINLPKGRIYQNAKHAKILGHTSACRHSLS